MSESSSGWTRAWLLVGDRYLRRFYAAMATGADRDGAGRLLAQAERCLKRGRRAALKAQAGVSLGGKADEMSDAMKKAQEKWEYYGGRGPVPVDLAEHLADGSPAAGEQAQLRADQMRYDLRLRLVCSFAAGGMNATGAILEADAVLARLDAEARGSR